MDTMKTLCDNQTASMTFGGEEEGGELWKMAQERRNVVLEFLNLKLSESVLRRHLTRVELLRKCSFYIEILPRHLAVGDQDHLMLPASMLQLIDPWKFQRMKKIGTTQTKIQLLLLNEYLEQLQEGRQALIEIIQTYDTSSYLSKWEVVIHRLSELSSILDSFFSIVIPGQLHIKHHLVSNLGTTKIPFIRLVLRIKTPVVFDRLDSVAHEDWVSLKWHSLGKQGQPEKYELCFKLQNLTSAQELTHRGSVNISTNSCEIHQLLQDRLYEFSVHRTETSTLVYEAWRDTIMLRTRVSHK
ncbi:fibronectin type III domain-containing protein 11 [Pelodytes ibericus]